MAHEGRVVAHADTAAELSNLNYQYEAHPGIRQWVEQFVKASGVTGQVGGCSVAECDVVYTTCGAAGTLPQAECGSQRGGSVFFGDVQGDVDSLRGHLVFARESPLQAVIRRPQQGLGLPG